MDLSYTQNMEDYHLWLAFGGKRSGSYIDIGAGHPIADNVSFFFYERGWQGIVVEPQRSLIDLYARLRPRDTAVAALIGTQSGTADFHVFDAFHGLSTTSAKFADAGAALGAGYRTIKDADDDARRAVQGARAGRDRLPQDRRRRRGGRRAQKRRLEALPAEGDRDRGHRARARTSRPGRTGSRICWRRATASCCSTRSTAFMSPRKHRTSPRRFRASAPRGTACAHMYEIGRAPENAGHPEHALAKILARGFWSSLPALDRDFAGRYSQARAARRPMRRAADAALAALDTEEFRPRLGRIACGYDGGQIYKEDTDEERR